MMKAVDRSRRKDKAAHPPEAAGAAEPIEAVGAIGRQRVRKSQPPWSLKTESKSYSKNSQVRSLPKSLNPKDELSSRTVAILLKGRQGRHQLSPCLNSMSQMRNRSGRVMPMCLPQLLSKTWRRTKEMILRELWSMPFRQIVRTQSKKLSSFLKRLSWETCPTCESMSSSWDSDATRPLSARRSKKQ